YFIDTHKNLNRKYLNYKILHFYLRNNSDIKDWTNIYTNIKMNKNTKTYKKKNFDCMGMNQNYTIISNLEPSLIKFFFFDWMRMNQKYSIISNLEPSFFLESVLPFDAYKIKQLITLIKLLLSNI
ncbi:unnamed protein product, partial [Musa acuminata subsp. malaccensis]